MEAERWRRQMGSSEVYKKLQETMAKRRGGYPALDIPEFYEMAEVLFTEEEAALSNAMPKGFFTAEMLASEAGVDQEYVADMLEKMADKGLCTSAEVEGTRFYGGPPFVPGIFEFQFMRGTTTDHDKKLARLIHNYKEAHERVAGPEDTKFPGMRVITVDKKIEAGNRVHTYDQVASYIESYDPISVSTCFCRHEAKLIDENDDCGKPMEVCMQFGVNAEFTAERGLGRKIDKKEALEILKKSEEAGLVHCSQNMQEITFLCNCCTCHCMVIKSALKQPKPALALYSTFQPRFDAELCTACETCMDNCPAFALEMGDDTPDIDLDRCFGCGVCATLCPSEAITLVERPGLPEPPADRKAYREAMKAAYQS